MADEGRVKWRSGQSFSAAPRHDKTLGTARGRAKQKLNIYQKNKLNKKRGVAQLGSASALGIITEARPVDDEER